MRERDGRSKRSSRRRQMMSSARRSAALTPPISPGGRVRWGAPDGAYVNIYATNEQIEWVMADDRIQGVSLTGSERAGEAVAALAGRNLKRAVLELGGSDPMILLDTPDLDATVETLARTRMSNMGQACTSLKRMLVMDDLYDEFIEKVTERMRGYVAGEPMDPETTLAPVSSEAAAQELIAQIQETVEQGATLLTGGKRVGSSVFTQDPERAARLGERIDAGMAFFNRVAGSQADLPFGGVKRSGLERVARVSVPS